MNVQIFYMSFDVILYFQRKIVITGNVELIDEECDWFSDDEKEDEYLSVKNFAVNNYIKCFLMKNYKNRIKILVIGKKYFFGKSFYC